MIPIYHINKIKKNLHESIIEVFKSCYDNDFLDTYIENIVIERNYNSIKDNKSDIKEAIRITKKEKNRYKKRWAQSVLKKINFDKNILKDFENLELKIKQELDEWVKSEDPIVSFKYINEKTKGQISKALKLDITLAITKELLNIKIIENPEIIIDNAVFSDKKTRIKIDKEKEWKDENTNIEYFYTDYKPTVKSIKDRFFSRMFVAKKLINDLLKENYINSFEEKDRKIFSFVMNQRGLEFIDNKTIHTKIGDIVSSTCKSDSAQSYESVKKRLLKMGHIRLGGVDAKGTNIVFGLFETVVIDDENNVTIEVNSLIHQQFIDNQIIKIYNDVIDGFNLELSNVMAFIIQRERIKCFITLEKCFDYYFFANRIRFKTKNKNNNMKAIVDSLSEIKNKKMMIDDFIIEGDLFYIKFIPLADYEIIDLIENTSFKELLCLPS